MSRAYATDTQVTTAKSRADIEELIRQHGALSYMTGLTDGHAIIAFETVERRVLIRLRLPDPNDQAIQFTTSGKARSNQEGAAALKREERRRWRALFLALKARFVAIAEGIETFDEAFLAHIVAADGMTVGDHLQAQLAAPGELRPLLPAPQRTDA
jgi:hypothetical protein